MFFRPFALALFGFLLVAGAAFAEEPMAQPSPADLQSSSAPAQQPHLYIKPTWGELLQTMIRFGALDISDSVLLDDYALIAECPIYDKYYDNDFQWEKIRGMLRKSVKMNVGTFPISYYYDMKTQLDRYDFANRQFNFASRATLTGVNVIILYNAYGYPCRAGPRYLPHLFRVVLTSVVNMDGIPMEEKEARSLISLMDIDDNPNRIIFARFNVRIVNVEPFEKIIDKKNRRYLDYGQGGTASREVRLDGHLDSVDFYEDEKMTKFIAKVVF